MDILYGKHAVLESMRSGREPKRLVLVAGRGDATIEDILNRANAANAVIEYVSRDRLNDIAHNEHHQGVAAYFPNRPDLSLDGLVAQSPADALILALDGVQDPHNLGALTRTADAAGIAGIILPSRRSVSITPAAVKVSAGATEFMPFSTVTNLVSSLRILKKRGFWCVGLDHRATMNYTDWDFTLPTVIIMGSEGDGMHRLTAEGCDATIAIPMVGHIESLNVAAAGAIVMYEALRQRQVAKGTVEKRPTG